MLNVSATKRDAKQYLARFKSLPERNQDSSKAQSITETDKAKKDEWRLQRTGVNLGDLYTPTRAIAEDPKFVQHRSQEQPLEQTSDLIHIAIVSIRAPETIDDQTLSGIALTLSQLVRLDMQIIVVFDCADSSSTQRELRAAYQYQGARLVKAIERHNNAGARYIDSAMSLRDVSTPSLSARKLDSPVHLDMPALLLEPLRRTSISVMPTLAYTADLRITPVETADVLLGLTTYLSKLDSVTVASSEKTESSFSTTLDRIVMVDPVGGLPAQHRLDKAHVFVNLEQEYDGIAQALEASSLEREGTGSSAAFHHLANLQTCRRCLAILPPSSSALLISPQEAASSSQPLAPDSESIGISTRRQKNPLIHNLLTNKPVISSSLPSARLSSPAVAPSSDDDLSPGHSTLVKRGMPVAIVPDPRKHPWTPPMPGQSTISLEDHPDINFPRLLALIEDSFRRPLDVKHYLARIRNRIAGVIIAGEYEGGAILTWEEPSLDASQEGGAERQQSSKRLVPYLDKFAVASRSQGSSGVADIVFQAMVRSCFPTESGGVCWRSRSSNPVNKWYFERSRGTWRLPPPSMATNGEGTDMSKGMWTMFWTTEGLESDKARWKDYVSVCESVVPSWADDKKPD